MSCDDNSCKLEGAATNTEVSENNELDSKSTPTTLVQDETSDLASRGKALLEKLGIKDVYRLDRKENEDPYAEPEYTSQQVPFNLNTEFFFIYFTASWCPPCQSFAPVLDSFVSDHSDKITLLVVSCDTDPSAFKKYISGKTWKYIDLDDKEVIEGLKTKFGVSLLPSLMVLNVEKLKLITTWGREAISYNPQECISDWSRGEEGFRWWHFFKFW